MALSNERVNQLKFFLLQFDLVCDLKWIRSTITSVQMGGVMTGAFIAGQAGDYFGRKRTNYGFYLLGAVFSVVAMFSSSWQMFMAIRFIIGISIGIIICYIYIPMYRDMRLYKSKSK